MSITLWLISGATVCLLLLLVWVFSDLRADESSDAERKTIEELGRRHVTYFPQVRQALAPDDYGFLESTKVSGLARRVRRERRRIGLTYLSCLRADFMRLWRMARVVAALSPQVGLANELARLRLGLAFIARYELLRFRFLFGFSPLPDLSSLSETVGKLAIRLETAMNEVGERAALAGEFVSTSHGRGVDTP